jgi:phosphoribosylformimino-5-aminoimidazole carboxamide ribotide isomerase
MRVIPVIDLKDGCVVRAVLGLRDLYKPIADSVYGTCKPVELATKLALEGFGVIYIADIDSIMFGQVNEEVFKSLRGLKVKLIADIGVTDEEKLEKAVELADYPVIATESVSSLSFLSSALKSCSNRAFVSLDLRGGKVVSRAPEISGKSPREACELLGILGVPRVILIDFDRIGSYSGPNVEGAKSLVEEGFEVYVGGGVRGLSDLIRLREVGVSGVLVASALHSGNIRAHELRALGLV